ncbi:MAG TPA: recombinase RecA [Candidatus Doudnabacteria bacterium]|mgnify:CR=1 FL=1|nr:recombinase RecA [Candidatus Doudnabacteria bacterium]
MAKAAKAKKTVEQSGRLGAIDNAIDQIKEKFGDGSIMKIADNQKLNVEAIPTGSISLDMALGVGGIPKGRIVEIYGPESSGKTTLTLHMIAETQKQGGMAAFIDAEHALDPDYAKKIGVKLDDLLVSQPDSGEQALDIAETLVRSNALDLIVIDSVAALTPRAEIEGEMGASHMGLQARLMSQALRKLTGIISKTHTTVIFINQIRMKIGVMFGNPETTTGGNALKFYASVRVEVRRSAQIKNGDKIIGNRTKAKVVKNKVAPPFKVAEFDIMYNEGISASGDVLDTGLLMEVISKSGNSYSFGDIKLGVGRETAKAFLKDNPEVFAEVDKALRDKLLTGDALPNKAIEDVDDAD